MPKYYLNDSNSEEDQRIAESQSTDYAIIMNSSQVRFFKNGNHIDNFNWNNNYSQPTKSKFSNLGTKFTRFFSGDNANPDSNNNAFAYMKANIQNFTNNSGLSW